MHLQTSFSCQTALGHVFQGRWFIFSVGWLWGTHTCVPGWLQREGRQKTTSVSSCLYRHSDHGADTCTAIPGGQSAVGLFMFSPWDPPPQPPYWGLFLWILSQPMARVQGDRLTSGLHLIPRLTTSQSSICYILQPLQNASCSEMLWGYSPKFGWRCNHTTPTFNL